MPDLEKISFAEKILFELQKIRRDVDNLEDLILANMGTDDDDPPVKLKRVAVPVSVKD